MTVIITLGNQKGGVAKTTTTAVLAYLLSTWGFKTLAVDMDSQGNLGETLTLRDSDSFSGRSVFEAIKKGDASEFIYPISENLDILPSTASLATLPEWLYSKSIPKGTAPQTALKKALSTVKDQYQYILIDTPPALGDHLINALTAATDAIALVETSKFSVAALRRYLSTVEEVRVARNPELRLCGILAALLDSRRADNKVILQGLKDEYKEELFSTVIKRIASTGRLSIFGFDEEQNPELLAAVKQFIPWVKEVTERVHN